MIRSTKCSNMTLNISSELLCTIRIIWGEFYSAFRLRMRRKRNLDAFQLQTIGHEMGTFAKFALENENIRLVYGAS